LGRGAAPRNRAPPARPPHPDELAGHDLIGFLVSGTVAPWRYRGDREYVISGRLQTNSGDAQREAALAGIGLVHAYAFHIADELARGKLEIVLADHERPPRPVHALYERQRAAMPKVRVFLDWVQQLIAAHATRTATIGARRS
jgi:LysR family transcriptional regulator for bpeEF and oprC